MYFENISTLCIELKKYDSAIGTCPHHKNYYFIELKAEKI
jgi:hypothetical protein